VGDEIYPRTDIGSGDRGFGISASLDGDSSGTSEASAEEKEYDS
jgi:hypothetical protein